MRAQPALPPWGSQSAQGSLRRFEGVCVRLHQCACTSMRVFGQEVAGYSEALLGGYLLGCFLLGGHLGFLGLRGEEGHLCHFQGCKQSGTLLWLSGLGLGCVHKPGGCDEGQVHSAF